MRDADANRLWFVQNPRSNRGNRVGYPTSLKASGHVALGTDGYPSDLDAEREVLQEEGARHGDDPVAAQRRPQAGQALLAERFGGRMPAAPAPGTVRDIDLETLRAQAAAEARRLWSRMTD